MSEPLTADEIGKITDSLLEVVPASHWLSVHQLLFELNRLLAENATLKHQLRYELSAIREKGAKP